MGAPAEPSSVQWDGKTEAEIPATVTDMAKPAEPVTVVAEVKSAGAAGVVVPVEPVRADKPPGTPVETKPTL